MFNVKSRSLETCDIFIKYSLAWPVLSQMQGSIFHPYTPSPELKKETTQRDTSNITPDISARALARLIYPLVFGFAITCLHNREKIHWRIVANKLRLRSHKDYRHVSLLQYPFYNHPINAFFTKFIKWNRVNVTFLYFNFSRFRFVILSISVFI